MPPEIRSEIVASALWVSDELVEIQSRVLSAMHDSQHELLLEMRSEVAQELGFDSRERPNLADLVDQNVARTELSFSPDALATVLPLSNHSFETTRQSRVNIENILIGADGRLIVVVGPCSIHDPETALEYAEKVREWRKIYGNDLEIIMRVYVEKPRSDMDWKGFIADPFLDGSNHVNVGIVATRLLLGKITEMGVPAATERLNPNHPQYFNGLIAYNAIGARNVSNQVSQEYVSGASEATGLKNPITGIIDDAIKATAKAQGAHSFLGLHEYGLPMLVHTKGNSLAHIILRGGDNGPNYSAGHIATTKAALAKRGLLQAIVVDVSHGNSGKKASRQIEAMADICLQVAGGETAIKGTMQEGFFVAGRQDMDKYNLDTLIKGMSVTDECTGIDETEKMLTMQAEAVQERRKAA